MIISLEFNELFSCQLFTERLIHKVMNYCDIHHLCLTKKKNTFFFLFLPHSYIIKILRLISSRDFYDIRKFISLCFSMMEKLNSKEKCSTFHDLGLSFYKIFMSVVVLKVVSCLCLILLFCNV